MVMRRPAPSRPATDGESTADDLVRLVLALVETLRQLIERQAIRRVEGGHLADDEVERLGLALLRLEQRMDELKDHFGLQDEDLSFRLDLGDLADIAMQESESLYWRTA
jgi:gas vesicle protein GvpK